MGATPSAPAAPPAVLERTLTKQAQEAITQQLMKARIDAERAKQDAIHYKQNFEEALDALDDVAAQHEMQKKLAAAAGLGVAVVAGALVYSRQELLPLQGGEKQRACRVESRRLRKADLHSRLVAEYEAAMAAAADGDDPIELVGDADIGEAAPVFPL